MFSGLRLTIDNKEIDFSARELVLLAIEVIQLKQLEIRQGLVDLPDYKKVDEEIKQEFYDFTANVAEQIEKNYQLQRGAVFNFVRDAYNVCKDNSYLITTITTNPQSAKLLELIKEKKNKEPKALTINVGDHILVPKHSIHMNSIEEWMFIARTLASNYLKQDFLSGWWFKIGGRIVRLRNDAKEGALPSGNKQFYAADHGPEVSWDEMPRNIQQCIQSFTWVPGGTYFRVFRFWLYFTLREEQQFKQTFVERVTDDILKDDIACRKLFFSLKTPLARPIPLQNPVLSPTELERREKLFKEISKRALCAGDASHVSGTAARIEWIHTKFITSLEQDKTYLERELDELLKDCEHGYDFPGITPQSKLSKEVIDAREKKFDRLLRDLVRTHQESIQEEFIVRMTEEIAASPEKCQLLLLSLAHEDPSFRGTTEESAWDERSTWELGGRRGILLEPEVSAISLSNELRKKYEGIFYHLIESFRYIFEANVKQRVEFMQKALNPFHTQIRNIMEAGDAEKYVMVHTLYELARKINLGEQEPLLREVRAYGDREAGNSYQVFETSVSQYLDQPDALSEAALAAEMRAILSGKVVDARLAFLPCLTAAWFISETARNPVTLMTSLILLDMLEDQITLNTEDGSNWYRWKHVCIHPLKSNDIGEVTDLNGRKINIDQFGGCHPMAHQGSVKQTESPPTFEPLSVARQKEGHLLIHWLQLKLDSFTPEQKTKYNLEKVEAKVEKSIPGAVLDLRLLETQRQSKKKQIKKNEDTIYFARKEKEKLTLKADDSGVLRCQKSIQKYVEKNKELQEETQKIDAEIVNALLKEIIREKMIKPLLRERASCFDRQLFTNKPQNAASSSAAIATVATLVFGQNPVRTMDVTSDSPSPKLLLMSNPLGKNNKKDSDGKQQETPLQTNKTRYLNILDGLLSGQAMQETLEHRSSNNEWLIKRGENAVVMLRVADSEPFRVDFYYNDTSSSTHYHLLTMDSKYMNLFNSGALATRTPKPPVP